MKFTISRLDGLVAINGEFLKVDLSLTSNKLRVVQWDGSTGHEEWTDKANTKLDSLDPYQHIVDAWYAAKADIEARKDPYYGMTPAQVLEAKRAKMTTEIMAEEDRQSYLPLEYTDGHTYKVSSAIQDTKLMLLGADLSIPLPLNNGCWDDINDVSVPMTVGEFFALALAAYTRGAKNYAVRKAHIVAMKQLANPLDYDYSGGWNQINEEE